MAKGNRISMKSANIDTFTPGSQETKDSTNGLLSGNKARQENNNFSEGVNSAKCPSKEASDGTSETSEIDVVDDEAD